MRDSSLVFTVFSSCRRLWQNFNRFRIALLASRAKQFQMLFSFIMIMLGMGFLFNSLVCILWKETCQSNEERDYLDDLANFCSGFGLCSIINMITWEWIYADKSTSWKITLNSGLIGGFGFYLTWLFLTYIWSRYAYEWCPLTLEDTNQHCVYLFLGLDMGFASVIFLYASYTITNQSVDVSIVCITIILIFIISFIFGYGVQFLTYNLFQILSNNFWAIIIVRTLSLFLRKVAKSLVNKLVNLVLARLGKNVKRKNVKIELRMVVKYIVLLDTIKENSPLNNSIPSTSSTSNNKRSQQTTTSTSTSVLLNKPPLNQKANGPTVKLTPPNNSIPSTSSTSNNNRSQQTTTSTSTSVLLNMTPHNQRADGLSVNSSVSPSSSNTSISENSDSITKMETVLYFFVPIDKCCKEMRENGSTNEIKACFDIAREIRLSPTLIINQHQIKSITAKLEFRLIHNSNDIQSEWLPFIYDPHLSTAFKFHQSLLNMHMGRDFDIPVKPDDDIALRFRFMTPYELKVPSLLAKIRAPAKPSGGSIYVLLTR